jgi:succinate-semialdehyde dehydrogenase/glutarate-semialdehyde dehydrogenase
VTVQAAAEQRLVDAVPARLLIAGEWVGASGGAELEVEDPSTGAILAGVADASPADALAALDAAVRAQDSWAAVAPRERGEILRRAYELIVARREELAVVMTLEMGKALAESRAEIDYAAEYFRWFAEEAVRIDGRYGLAPDGRSRLVVQRRPVGPCLLITPWNFPLAMGTRKIGPAVAAGCTMVVKPAGQTPLSMLALGAIMAEAGLPAGVLNIVTTSRSGPTMAPLISDSRLRKLSFTGSTEVGRTLAAASGERLLRLSMELGGNAPFVVFADADVDAAVDGAMLAKMRNGGQACTAANRFLVHRSLADEFAERFAARMGALRLGRGTDPEVDVGPLIDGAQRAKVGDLVADAVDHGAEVLAGGEPVDRPGYFSAPTVLWNPSPQAAVLREEIFGPVAPISTFDEEDEAVAAANATEYGLVAYVYTRDIDRGLRLFDRIDTGMLAINRGVVSNPAAPFGGIKQSGYGREGGREGIEDYLTIRYAAIDQRQ